MPTESSREVIKRYIEDAIVVEQNFETQLKAFSREGDQAAVQRLFAEYATETRYQHQRLTARLEQLGGTASVLKSFLVHVFNFTQRTTHVGQEPAEKSSQNLIVAFGIENSKIAMYEELAVVAAYADDVQTERLARMIQEEERAAARKMWGLIEGCCRQVLMPAVAKRGNVA